MKILIIEDDIDMSEMLRVGLNGDGHISELAHNGTDGSFLGRSFEYDAIVLDYSLPKKNGLLVCEEIRKAGKTTPIIFLSATDDPLVKIKALDSGADDYMTKPFLFEELRARLNAITRRSLNVKQPVLKIHDLSLDKEKHIAMRGKRRIRATNKEFGLLEYLMSNGGTVLSRTMILEHVWTADCNPFSNTVEAHIRNLRKKLNAGNKPDLIANIAGRGYIMDTPENLAKY